jgi:iron complex transport system permease protein
LFVIGIPVVFLTLMFTLTIGRYPIDLKTLGLLLKAAIQGESVPAELATPALVLNSIRLPRVIMAFLVGAALSVSGAMLQGVFRNPLVSPMILGVTSGASFGAALAIVVAGHSALAIQGSSFFWALNAVFIAVKIGHRVRHSVTTLVLAGVIVSAVFMSGLSFLKYRADPYEQLPEIVFWTMGSLNNILWADVIRTLIVVVSGIIILHLFRWTLNPMALGDEDAMGLGVNVRRARMVYILISTLIVAVSVSCCGDIKWLGLVVPHMARMIIGADHTDLIPFSALLGGLLLLLIDTLTRALPGGEMPIGILTSLLGGPFFAYLLIRQERDSWQQ